MKCPESEAQLQRRLDGEGVADRADLDRHLTECSVCRERFTAATRLLDEGLAALLRPDLPDSIWTRQVVAALLADQRRRRRRAFRLAALGTAAALLAAVLAGWAWTRPGRPVAPESDLQARHEEKQQEPSLRATVAEAEQAMKSLGNRIADNTVGPVRTLFAVTAPAEVGPMPTLPTVASIEQPLDPAARSLQGTGRGVSTGIQTVAGSARRAFDFLVREMPPVAQE